MTSVIDAGLPSRFELRRRVARGAMGEVYQAWDAETQSIVAIKVIRDTSPIQIERFGVEVELLSLLSHPRIVQYLAHGTTDRGEPFLVMEWLEGETLAERLVRTRLTVTEAVAIARASAEGLAFAHARGVVHRDVKPANLFLVEGRVGEVKLTDFGIASRQCDSARAAQGGLLSGSPSYMSPEQARGDRADDPRIDIWGLGCVLFECLAGGPPFRGDNVTAVLAKILIEPLPPLRTLLPTLPPDLYLLIEQLLEKGATNRPFADDLPPRLTAIAKQLSAIDAYATIDSVGGPAHMATYSHGWAARREQRIVTALLVGGDAGAMPLDERSKYEDRASYPSHVDPETHRVLRSFGAQLDRLLDGTRLITWGIHLGPKEQLLQAARCAQAIRDRLDGPPMVLATGRAVVDGTFLLGEVLDRAVELLQTTPPGEIRLDASSASLLAGRFEISAERECERGTLALHAERTHPEPPRSILGRVTPFIGRELDLETVANTVRDAIEERQPRALLVTGPPGIGKTRLVHAFLQTLRTEAPLVQLLVGRADPLSVGAPLGLIGSVMRELARFTVGDSIGAQQAKLRAVAVRYLPEDPAKDAPLLGDLASVPFPHDPGNPLDTEGGIAASRGDRSRSAWLRLVDALGAEGPVVLVLDDFQWGDAASVQLIDVTLRTLTRRPFIVLALGRPEVTDAFPRLWRDRQLSTLRLASLGTKAPEQLMRELLGTHLSSDKVRSLVESSGGNPFYLEELLRVADPGRATTDLPDTIIAMVQAHLDNVGQDAKRILSMGSVFGGSFTRAGLQALLADETPQQGLDTSLSILVDRGLIVASSSSDPGGEGAFVFHRPLIRQGAYAFLTEQDLDQWHRRAGGWLGERGDVSPEVVADHFERGRAPDLALAWLTRAAEGAMRAQDFDGVIACVNRACRAGGTGASLGALLSLQAEAYRARGELSAVIDVAVQARHRLPVGVSEWERATRLLIFALTERGETARADELERELRDCDAVSAKEDQSPV